MAKYSFEQKLEAVLGVLERNLSKRESGRQIGAYESDVRKWVRMYQEHGIERLVMRKITPNTKHF